MEIEKFLVTSPNHMQSLLVDELGALGLAQVREVRSGAECVGGFDEAYRVCLWSRIANRVLLPLTDFAAADPQQLYRGAQAIDWSEHLGVEQTLAVDFHSRHSAIAHSQFGAQKIKDAIVDQFRERCGERPSVSLEQPDLRIAVFVERDRAWLSLDLSGDSLHRRGYRRAGMAAPLKENLAAAVLLRAGWPEIAAGGGSLLDPLCGSGTLLIEGAMMAADQAPGLLRGHWGFSGWRQHRAELWRELLSEARARAEQGRSRLPSLIGADRDARALRGARDNARMAGFGDCIAWREMELAAWRQPPPEAPGLLVTNPPYGVRLGDEPEVVELYRQLGHVFKAHFTGWRAALLSATPELGKELGLRSFRQHSLYNGALLCKLLHFRIESHEFREQRRLPAPLLPAQWSDGGRMLANRLQKNRRRLAGWLQQQQVQCYRLYDADLPDYALALDIYQDDQQLLAHVQEYQAPASIDAKDARRRLREALSVIREVLQIGEEQMFLKVRQRQKGAAQYQKLGDQGQYRVVQEAPARLLVNLEDYLDSGLFLDHRSTRRLIGQWAAGQDFLNLFAYTGSASVHAGLGGARSTTSVDLSRSYLDWARQNMRLNGLLGEQHRFLQEDCLAWLRGGGDGRRYGLIFLDPPSFSTSKRMDGVLDVQRDHVALIRAAVDLLTADGVLLFSSNLRGLKLDTEALAPLLCQDISRRTLPLDFARNPKIHRCWRISRG